MMGWGRGSQRGGTGDRLFDRRVAATGRVDHARQTRCAAGIRLHRRTAFDRDRVADYQKMVATASRRQHSRRALSRQPRRHRRLQPNTADRRNSPCVISLGGDEKARGEVQMKDLIEGTKAAAAIASNQRWHGTRPAQFSCRKSRWSPRCAKCWRAMTCGGDSHSFRRHARPCATAPV